MTVAELRALLDKYPDNMQVMLTDANWRIYRPNHVTDDTAGLSGERVVVLY